MKTRTKPKRFRTGIIGRKPYRRIVRILERMREKCVGDWACAVVRNTTTRQRRALLTALAEGFGPIKLPA